MSRRLRGKLWIWHGLSLAWMGWAAGFAGAEPPQYCRDLAVQFGTAPAQLDANSLASLGSCVMAEIQERAGNPSHPPPDTQQPDPSQGSPIDQPGWGKWSSPTPWSDDRGKTQPWGNQ